MADADGVSASAATSNKQVLAELSLCVDEDHRPADITGWRR
jgi:hypothetical protein